VLGKAWAEHGGTEIGTEGDSFFVVFPTAEGAVAAAAQAQLELDEYTWPAGERVRVRMGIHTGSPQVHDGGYVGMDVHRAARIAGSAHGGQVVLSAATANLSEGRLPQGVVFRDLGSYQLKDLPKVERLYQLQIDGLRTDFAPLKSLGAASSLPLPATPLVGRDGELAELAAVLALPDVRLVTLTGPGGSGKTRLAIAVAHRLVPAFPDGVYFVPLAPVTTPDAMWTSIAETLDVPPEARTPPLLFAHVAHSQALVVLDNLEQLPGAERVVADLLDAAPSIKLLATSRRPLHLPGEQEHPVPPLELPDGSEVDEASESGAVQMFVQQARLVRPSFVVTADNAADVAAVCRRLDGLPLAIELAATRSKLLSPHALLARLDTALDLAARGSTVSSRQKTLRDTIAWSYDLLDPSQQAVFRRLGVFAGGADLDAIRAVTADIVSAAADPLDLVAELVDASLVTIGEDAVGEPRVGMLETIRTFALDQLTVTGDLDLARELHALHYLGVAEALDPLMARDQHVEACTRFASEHDNFREVLGWALPDNACRVPADRVTLGLRLCTAVDRFWFVSGYHAEARQWLERAVDRAGGDDSPELAACLPRLAGSLDLSGDLERAHGFAVASVDMWRRLGDASKLAWPLTILAHIQAQRDRVSEARRLFEEAVEIARRYDDPLLHGVLNLFGGSEFSAQNYERSLVLHTEAIAIANAVGDHWSALIARQNIAAILMRMGKAAEACVQLSQLIPEALALGEPQILMSLAEDYATVLCALANYESAVLLLGAADALHERLGSPRDAIQDAWMADPVANARASLTPQQWDDAYLIGRNTRVEDALTTTHDAEPTTKPHSGDAPTS
jgi:predicted ATPase